MNLSFLVTQVAGVFVIASVVVLLYKKRVFIDKETGHPIEFEMPVLGKLKSQNPVIVMLLVGAGMVLYPAQKSWPEADLEATIDTHQLPASLMIVAQPKFSRTQYGPEPIKARIPLVPEADEYVLTVLVGKQIVAQRTARVESDSVVGKSHLRFGTVALNDSQLAAPAASQPPILPQQDGSDEEIRRLRGGN